LAQRPRHAINQLGSVGTSLVDPYGRLTAKEVQAERRGRSLVLVQTVGSPCDPIQLFDIINAI
jgi:hypothetical protein